MFQCLNIILCIQREQLSGIFCGFMCCFPFKLHVSRSIITFESGCFPVGFCLEFSLMLTQQLQQEESSSQSFPNGPDWTFGSTLAFIHNYSLCPRVLECTKTKHFIHL